MSVVSVLAVGDVGAKRDNPDTMFEKVAGALKGADICFGQLETVVTSRGAMSPNARLAMRTGPEFAPALARAGFDVMSFAGNHCLDWGYEGFNDTLEIVDRAGVKLCGAGANLGQARKPVICEASGLKIAFLAYNSILPEGYAATRDRAGCAPLRAHTAYVPKEPDQPGTQAEPVSSCDPQDLDALRTDVAAAQAVADCVLVSFHWGIHMTEAVIAHYQREAARVAIDCGAAAVIGHHAHILKGIEFYKGAPIFYSLGNFAIEQPHIWDPAIVETESFAHLASLNPGFDRSKIYMLPHETRYTGIAHLDVTAEGVVGVKFLPAFIGDDSVPERVGQHDLRYGEIAAYLGRICAAEGMRISITPDRDSFIVDPTDHA